MNMKKVASVAAIATIAAVGLTGCATSSTSSSSSSSATVLLDWFPNPDHIGLYTAESTGAFTTQGVTVKLQSPSSTSDAAKLVSTGKVDLAISYEPDAILASANGMDITAVAAIIPTALNSVIISGANESISSLAGTKIGNPGTASSQPTLKYILNQAGVSSSSVTNVNLSQGLVEPLIAGKVSAVIGGYSNIEGVQVSSHGEYTIKPVNELGVPNYDELVVIANKTKLASDSSYAELVKKVLAGIKAGTEKAIASPTTAYTAISGVAKGYSTTELKTMVNATAPLLKNSLGFGFMDATAWDSYATWMYQNGLLTKEISGSSVMTNDYLTK